MGSEMCIRDRSKAATKSLLRVCLGFEVSGVVAIVFVKLSLEPLGLFASSFLPFLVICVPFGVPRNTSGCVWLKF